MRKLSDLVRSNIKELEPYSTARNEYKGDGKIFLDANENPFGTLNRYPDPMQKELKKEIQRVKDIDEAQIFIGNGSDEVIDLCFRVFCQPRVDKAVIFSPTYGMYDVAAAINDVELIKIPLNRSSQPDVKLLLPYADDETVKLLILCSPNNPTGNLLEGVEDILQLFEGIVLIDEAYIDFADADSFIRKLKSYPNLIVAQTLSKAYGLAAVRIGMAFASPDIINLFNKVKPPYNVSSVNQDVAIKILKEDSVIVEQRWLLVDERKRLAAALIAEDLVEWVYPSDANFLLVRVADANRLYDTLINEGIVCRNRHAVINNCIRITIGTPEENDKLLYVLKKIIMNQ